MAVHDLRNKRVLITGAGSGIGRAAALAFVRQQAHVIASDIEPSALQALRDEIEALGGACSIYTVDVADASAMQRFAAQMAQDGGAPDVLINNAGIGYLGQFLKSDLAHWRRVLDINLMGVVNGCHHFLPLMLAAGGPRQVLNVASTAGLYPAPAMAAYAASKFAVFGFSEVLKMELDGSQIGVTTVCPGVINTPIVRARHNMSPSVTDEQVERLQAYYSREGCAAELVGEAMVRAARSGQSLLLIGPFAKLVFHLRRISLGLARRVMLADARKVGYL